MNTFNNFNLNSETLKFIDLNNFKQPTLIQEKVISKVLSKKNVVAISATGTGKTHAYLIPIMNMIDPEKDRVQVVITAPTRELATQIYNNAKLITKANEKIIVKLVTGGINKKNMVDSLKVQPHIVIGTPGRIRDLFLSESVLRVDTADIFVLDEADMTLEYGFLDDVDAICGRMKKDLQMVALSATMPLMLKQFLKKYMTKINIVDIKDNENFNPKINHILIPCKHKSYSQVILDIIEGFIPYVCLIFANTREEASNISNDLRDKGLSIVEIHGGLSSRQRKQALKELTSLTKTFVVATDIASRGLDVDGVTHVISCGFPSELDFYIHRAGRTGRAGKEGTCYALYTENDKASIEALINQGIVFDHKTIRSKTWKTLKPYGYKRPIKNDKMEIEIAKKLTKKNMKVKPGYKKKRKAEVEKIKKRERSLAIKEKIKAQKKEMFKKQQREKNRQGN